MNSIVRPTTYEFAEIHDRTIPTRRELVERDRERITGLVIQLAMKSGSASQAVLIGEEK